MEFYRDIALFEYVRVDIVKSHVFRLLRIKVLIPYNLIYYKLRETLKKL